MGVTVTLEDMKDKLYSLEDVTALLEPTENLTSYPFVADGSSKVEFQFPDNWHESGLKDQPDLFITDVSMQVGETLRPLTKAAVLEATSLMSIPKELAMKTPAQFLGPQLNWWYANTTKGKSVNLVMLANEHAAHAVVPQAKVVFSNLMLLEEAVKAAKAKYGSGVVLLFDKKFHHDLRRTNIRMILPEIHYDVDSARAAGSTEADTFYGGVHIANSLIGENTTLIEGYIFSWWCENGATTSHTLSSRHKRKAGEDPADVYTWAGGMAESIVDEIHGELEQLDGLTKLALEGDVVETIHTVYDHYAVPQAVRQAIQDNMTESDDITGFGLMQAITATANVPDLGWKQIEDIMRVGGDMPHVLADRCSNCHRF